MYYLSNESIIAAIGRLHAAGAHESFRNYLVLKAHGLKFLSDEYVPVTTTNTKPSLDFLFRIVGLSDSQPFYNPLRNELLKWDAARGVIQTNVKKYLDEATKTKMKWMEGYQAPDSSWQIRFSAEYPKSLGRGEAGLADSDSIQLSVHRPSFVIWLNRDGEWDQKPELDDLWENVKERLNLHVVECDLLFTKDRVFDDDPFVTMKPDRSKLVEFIAQEVTRGQTREVLKFPDRRAFSEAKVQRIISSHRLTEQQYGWWNTRDLEREALEVLDETRALLLVGPPGTGKTRLALELAGAIAENEGDIHLFQFHASYAYEDFIEALVPKPHGGALIFEPTLKRFAQVCEAAIDSKQVVVLDELNRADVSKVFGEAFFLIEMSYRDEKYAIRHLYDPTRKFWIPRGLYLIGTLNNLDKSTYDLDFAFRRRFGQVDVVPDADLLEQVVKAANCRDEDFVRILRSAFNEMQVHFPLGHAYFKSVKDRESLRGAYRRVIRPTIAAYLGQYRQDELGKIDSIVRRVCETPSWEAYIAAED